MTRPEMTAPTPPNTPTIAEANPAECKPRRNDSSRNRQPVRSKATEAIRSTMGKCVLPPCTRCQNNASITSLAKSRVNDRERMVAFDVVHFRDAKHGRQYGGFNFHRTRLRCPARFGLRKGGGSGCVESDVSLNFSQRLMDVTVKDCDGPEAFQIAEGPLGVACPPAPLRINGPERNMGENDNWSAARESAYIILQPGQLLLAQKPQSALGDVEHVYQSDEVHTTLIEAEPAVAFAALAVAQSELFAIVANDVVFPGDIEDVPCFGRFEQLLQGVEFPRF